MTVGMTARAYAQDRAHRAPPRSMIVRKLSDDGKLFIAQWYAARANKLCGEELKRLYARTEKLLNLLPDTVATVSIMLGADRTSSGHVETATLRVSEHAIWAAGEIDRAHASEPPPASTVARHSAAHPVAA